MDRLQQVAESIRNTPRREQSSDNRLTPNKIAEIRPAVLEYGAPKLMNSSKRRLNKELTS